MARPNLHERVLDQLGLAIAAGDPASGDVLRIEHLADRFSVSRSVIREAVRVLESMRVVQSRRRVGVTVLARSAWNPFDPRMIRWRLAGPDRMVQLQSLTEMRFGIEPVAAALAATNAEPAHCGDLAAAVIGMASTGRAGDLDAYLGHDIAFHRALLIASGNEMFASLGDVVAEVLTGRTMHHMMPEHPKPVAVRLHMEVADAIQSRDPDAARLAMHAILVEASEAMSRIVDGALHPAAL